MTYHVMLAKLAFLLRFVNQGPVDMALVIARYRCGATGHKVF